VGLVQELDYFATYCEIENKEKRISDKDYEKIIKAVDTLQNAMEELGY